MGQGEDAPGPTLVPSGGTGVSDADLEAIILDQGGATFTPQAGMTVTNVSTGETVRLGLHNGEWFALPLSGQTAQAPRLDGVYASASGIRFEAANGRILEGAFEPSSVRTIDDEIRLMEERARIARREGNASSAQSFERQLAILREQQAFSSQEREKAEEFSLRINRLNSLDNLTQRLAELQVTARTSAIESIGRSPFRGAIRASGGVMRGLDPLLKLQGELQEFANQEIPSVSPRAGTGEIQGAIDTTTGIIRNVPARPLNLRHGGVLDMVRGRDGSFTIRNRATGENGDSIITGERGVPEITQFLPDGTIRVTPLEKRAKGAKVAGQAAHGGEFDALPAFEGIDASQSTELGSVQGLGDFFNRLGFEGRTPLATRLPDAFGGIIQAPLLGTGEGLPTQAPSGGGDLFNQLGTRPRLVFDPQRQTFLHVTPAGEIKVIGDSQRIRELGVSTTDAVTMTAEQLEDQGFQFSGAIATSVDLNATRGRFGELSPILAPLNEEGTRNVLLPDPRLIGAIWHELDPAVQRLVIDIYTTAEVSPETLRSRIRSFTPGGVSVGQQSGFRFGTAGIG